VVRETTSSDVRLDCTADSEERALQICDAVVAAYSNSPNWTRSVEPTPPSMRS
jgi:hypothetical protein